MRVVIWGIIIAGIMSGAIYVGVRISNESVVLLDDRVGLEVGEIAPAYSYVSTDKTSVRSDELKGKVIVMTSAAMWCHTCVIEAQQFAGAYHSLRNADVHFITVDIDPNESDEIINAFRKNYVTPWDYTNAIGGSELITQFKLDRFEITYIIDRDGIIRYKDNSITNTEELEQAILSLL